jgi:hypothetical protein
MITLYHAPRPRYLTDAFRKKGTGPLPGHRDRAEYARWLFFHAGTVEPPAGAHLAARPACLRAQKREDG